MTAYRRNLVAGGTYFFTVNLADRRWSLLTENVELLWAAFRYTRHRHPFTIDAIVILPDHLHALWTLPAADSDFATRWRLIKTTFSRALRPTERVSASRSRKRERGVWQRRFWERILLDTSITFTSIRSSTATCSGCKIGHFRRSIAWCGSAFTHQNGRALPAMSRMGALVRDDGYRSAQPILRTAGRV
jgi:putative transposase